MKRTKKSIAKRREIAESSLGLLKRMSLNEITVNAICQEADISVGTFYHHFEDKDDLLSELYLIIDSYLENFVEPNLTGRDVESDLYLFAEGYANNVLNMTSLLGQSLTSFGIPYPSTAEEIAEEHQRKLFVIPRNIMCKGVEEGVFQENLDLDDMTEYLIVAMRGRTNDWSRRSGCYDIKAAFQKDMGKFLSMIKK